MGLCREEPREFPPERTQALLKIDAVGIFFTRPGRGHRDTLRIIFLYKWAIAVLMSDGRIKMRRHSLVQFEVGTGLRTDRGKRLRRAGDVPPYQKGPFTSPTFDRTLARKIATFEFVPCQPVC